MLALRPAPVRLERAERRRHPAPVAELLPALRAGGVRAVAQRRARRPDRRTADEGRALLDALVADLAAAIDRWVEGGDRERRRVALVTGAARANRGGDRAHGWRPTVGPLVARRPRAPTTPPCPTRSPPEPSSTRWSRSAAPTVVARGRPTSGRPDRARRRGRRGPRPLRRPRRGGRRRRGASAAGPRRGARATRRWTVHARRQPRGRVAAGDGRGARASRRPEPRHGRFVAISSAGGHSEPCPSSPATRRQARRHRADGRAWPPSSGRTASPPTPSPRLDHDPHARRQRRGLRPHEHRDFRRHHVLGRLLTPDEVAAPVAFLCRPDAGGITGAVIPVDAGMSAT